jgi:hypothetical protein
MRIPFFRSSKIQDDPLDPMSPAGKAPSSDEGQLLLEGGQFQRTAETIFHRLKVLRVLYII